MSVIGCRKRAHRKEEKPEFLGSGSLVGGRKLRGFEVQVDFLSLRGLSALPGCFGTDLGDLRLDLRSVTPCLALLVGGFLDSCLHDLDWEVLEGGESLNQLPNMRLALARAAGSSPLIVLQLLDYLRRRCFGKFEVALRTCKGVAHFLHQAMTGQVVLLLFGELGGINFQFRAVCKGKVNSAILSAGYIAEGSLLFCCYFVCRNVLAVCVSFVTCHFYYSYKK